MKTFNISKIYIEDKNFDLAYNYCKNAMSICEKTKIREEKKTEIKKLLDKIEECMEQNNFLNKIPCKKEPIAYRTIDNEVVVILPQISEVNILNEVGTRIWELIDGTKTISEIISIIFDEYDVEKEELEKDTIEFINKLKESEMILWK